MTNDVNYRMLSDGEMILQGDEYYGRSGPFADDWHLTEKAGYYVGHVKGLKYRRKSSMIIDENGNIL